MIQRPVWSLVSLLAIALAAAPAGAQLTTGTSRPAATTAPAATHPVTSSPQLPASTHSTSVAPKQPQTTPEEPPVAQDTVASQQPQIIVTSPPPAANTWLWHERVAWAASIVLAVLGYVGILLALRTLGAIRRSNEASLETARAALTASESMLSQTKALLEFERPWILVHVEASLTAENSFMVTASNRGRRPARITQLIDQVNMVPADAELPPNPEFDATETPDQEEPTILLPGESTVIARFHRKDIAQICKTESQLQRVASWKEVIYLLGRVTYLDISPASADASPYQTDWCCRYIHGETKSALIIGGPQAYNRHL
ncbi:MAG: hypothetical protein KGL64_04765 [Acidobacteriota bacterium]|nr:hypothetical protein [Acidobacteriota bacterium]